MDLNEDYSDAGFRKKFMAKERRDELEESFIEGGVKEEAEKILKRLAKEPKEFQKRVAIEVARQAIE
jgi:hypothetical protein